MGRCTWWTPEETTSLDEIPAHHVQDGRHNNEHAGQCIEDAAGRTSSTELNLKAVQETDMWPFRRNNKSTPVPVVRCGSIDVAWDSTYHSWKFSDGEIDYSFSDNPVFDPSVLQHLPKVSQWLEELDCKIHEEVKKYLAGWCDWQGEKDLVDIDVSWLVARNEVDVSYAHEDWGDLGVNVVITDGRITDSYAGD